MHAIVAFAFLASLTIVGIIDDSGVGQGRNVLVTQNGDLAAWGVTDAYSEVTVSVPDGIYDVEIVMPRTNPFYVWVCQAVATVDDAKEYLFVNCVRQWRLQLPFLRGV